MDALALTFEQAVAPSRRPPCRLRGSADGAGQRPATRVYLANHDARAALTLSGMWRVHRLDQINALKPANLLDFRSLTLRAAGKQIGRFKTVSRQLDRRLQISD